MARVLMYKIEGSRLVGLFSGCCGIAAVVAAGESLTRGTPKCAKLERWNARRRAIPRSGIRDVGDARKDGAREVAGRETRNDPEPLRNQSRRQDGRTDRDRLPSDCSETAAAAPLASRRSKSRSAINIRLGFSRFTFTSTRLRHRPRDIGPLLRFP